MPSAVILAGGLGTRLRGAVPDLPKPMAPINGRPFLEYQLDYWICQGVTRFVLSVGYRHEVIMRHFGFRYKGAELEYAVEERPLGTGGGFLRAVEQLGRREPFVLLNGDTYFEVEREALDAVARDHDADWCFSLFRTSEQGRYLGIELAPDGRILSLNEQRTQDVCLANGGVYWVHPRALEGIRAFPSPFSLEHDLFPHMLASGQRFIGLESRGVFIDIGVPEDYYRAATLLGGPDQRGTSAPTGNKEG